MIEYLEAAVFLKIIRSNFGDDLADPVNVIGQDDATHGFNKNHAEGFVLVGRTNISEPNSQHNGGGPIVAPNILFIPLGIA